MEFSELLRDSCLANAVETCWVVMVVIFPFTVDSVVARNVVRILLAPDSDPEAVIALSDELAVVLGSHHTGFVVVLPISSVVITVVRGSCS